MKKLAAEEQVALHQFTAETTIDILPPVENNLSIAHPRCP
jgi:hypothetical protein